LELRHWVDKKEMKRRIESFILSKNLFDRQKDELDLTKHPKLRELFGLDKISRANIFKEFQHFLMRSNTNDEPVSITKSKSPEPSIPKASTPNTKSDNHQPAKRSDDKTTHKEVNGHSEATPQNSYSKITVVKNDAPPVVNTNVPKPQVPQSTKSKEDQGEDAIAQLLSLSVTASNKPEPIKTIPNGEKPQNMEKPKQASTNNSSNTNNNVSAKKPENPQGAKPVANGEKTQSNDKAKSAQNKAKSSKVTEPTKSLIKDDFISGILNDNNVATTAKPDVRQQNQLQFLLHKKDIIPFRHEKLNWLVKTDNFWKIDSFKQVTFKLWPSNFEYNF